MYKRIHNAFWGIEQARLYFAAWKEKKNRWNERGCNILSRSLISRLRKKYIGCSKPKDPRMCVYN